MPLPQTGFVTLTNKEPFMKYPPAVAQMLKAHGGGYVGVKPGVKDDAVGSEDARDVDLAPVLELPSRAAATKWLKSDEYLAVKPFRGDGSEAVLYQEQCDAYDFAVLIGFPTYENAVEYINDPEFGAEQTKVRRATTTGPLAAIKATSETMGIPQHTGVPHVR